MMEIRAVFALFCDQLSLVFFFLLGDKAMRKGEEACWRLMLIHVGLVALAIESIYIEVVVHIVESSTFACLRLYEVSIYNTAAFCYGFRIVKRIAFCYNCFFGQLVNLFLIQIQMLNLVICIVPSSSAFFSIWLS